MVNFVPSKRQHVAIENTLAYCINLQLKCRCSWFSQSCCSIGLVFINLRLCPVVIRWKWMSSFLKSDNSHCFCFLSSGKNILVYVSLPLFYQNKNGNDDSCPHCDYSPHSCMCVCVLWWPLKLIGPCCVQLPVRVPNRQEIRAWNSMLQEVTER